ncbi:MAG: hypothetical protein WKF84_16040 [Pyrinomonadaceae bacterium]
MHHIKSSNDIDEALGIVNARLSAHPEWLCAEGDVELRSVALRFGEWSLEVQNQRLIFSYWGDRGAHTWFINGWDMAGTQIILSAVRGMGRNHALLKITPRLSVQQEVESLSAARRQALSGFTELVRANFPDYVVERATLSPGAHPGIPGRYARLVLLHTKEKTRVAVTGDVNQGRVGDCGKMLSSALLWFNGLSGLVKPARKMLLLMIPEDLEETGRLISLLRRPLRADLEIHKINAPDEHPVQRVAPLLREEILKQKARVRLYGQSSQPALSLWSQRIAALAPEAIDVMRSRHGETLRFHGLAFARVRRLMEEERAWFGVNHHHRQSLNDENWTELLELVAQLRHYRSAEADDRNHAFYRAALKAGSNRF